MNRKSFLKTMGWVTTGLYLGNPLQPDRKQKSSITVLHTNDTMAHVEPLPEYEGQYGGLGGMARRATLVNRHRDKAAGLLLVDSGNVFGDTAYADLYGMELIYRMMSDIGYDAATVGYRDFEHGIRAFLDATRNADFPFIVSNYNVKHGDLARFLHKYRVFNKGGIRIGVFGLGATNLDQYAKPDVAKNIEYRDPILISEAMVRKLRYQKDCDLILCLSHLGFRSNQSTSVVDDLQLAKDVDGIDMIVGAKSRRFMQKGKKIRKSEGEVTVVSQAGYGGAMVGRTTFGFAKRNWLDNIFSSNYYLRQDI